jgi:hypothetical protein
LSFERFLQICSAIGVWDHEFKEGCNWMDIEGNMNYGRCDESAGIRGRVSAESEKKEKAVPGYYKSQSSHLQCDIPFFPNHHLEQSQIL